MPGSDRGRDRDRHSTMSESPSAARPPHPPYLPFCYSLLSSPLCTPDAALTVTVSHPRAIAPPQHHSSTPMGREVNRGRLLATNSKDDQPGREPGEMERKGGVE
eukprot:578437-Rhodomonas_salina.1